MEYFVIGSYVIQVGHAWLVPVWAMLCLVRRRQPIFVQAMMSANLLLALAALSGAILLAIVEANEYFFLGKGAQFSLINRLFGPYWFVFATNLILGTVMPMFLLWRRLRRSIWFSLMCCLQIWVLPILQGWLLRLPTTDYLPSSWEEAYELPWMGIWYWSAYLLILATMVLFARQWPNLWRTGESA
jgi:hypothetical protein